MKKTLKLALNGLALLIACPFGLVCKLLVRMSGSDSVFHDFSQLFSIIPGFPGDYLRKAFYRCTLNHCSLDVKISFGTLIAHPQTEIHEGAYIGPYCLIGKAVIGRHATLGSGVHLLSGKQQHRFDRMDVPIQDQGGTFEKISVGSDCWIGNGSIVMATIGDKSIIGAGSVVISPIESGTIAVGNPAHILRRRAGAGATAT